MTHPNSFSLSCSQNADSHSSTAMERKWRIPFWKKLWLENMLTFGDSQNRASMLPNSSPKTISRTHLHKASWAFQCLSQIENKWQALYVKSLYYEREKPKNIEKKKFKANRDNAERRKYPRDNNEYSGVRGGAYIHETKSLKQHIWRKEFLDMKMTVKIKNPTEFSAMIEMFCAIQHESR